MTGKDGLPKTFFTCLALAVALAGCVETGRRRVQLSPELIHDARVLKKPGITVTVPRPEGLSGFLLDKSERLYRAAKTDTLVVIAERFYGDRSMSSRLYEANRDLLRASGGLKRGMVIVLPRFVEQGEAELENKGEANG